MSASRLRILGLMIASSWLLVGCSGAKKIDVGGTCVLNSDCNQSLVCTAGKCHDACHTSGDCPLGQSCIIASDQSTVCQLPVETHCAYNSDCQPSLVCAADLKCRNQCQGNVDCSSGQTCTTTKTCAEPSQVDSNNNLFAPDGGVSGCPVGAETCSCYPNDTCNAGLTCASHLCVSLGTGGASGGTGGASGAGGILSAGGTVNTGGTTATGGIPSTGGTTSSTLDAGWDGSDAPDATITLSQAVALFHFDGTEGSTVLTDSSGTGKVAAITGNPIISTAQSKFGGASLYVNGTSVSETNYVRVNASDDFTFPGDLTIDWWQYVVTYTNYTGSFVQVLAPEDKNTCAYCANACWNSSGSKFHFINYPQDSVAAPTNKAWHHIALTRAGGVFRAFIDGQLVATDSSTATIRGLLGITGTAGNAVNGDFNGYIDELRVVRGTAVWTSDFTPPTAAYP